MCALINLIVEARSIPKGGLTPGNTDASTTELKPDTLVAMQRTAKFRLGQIVKHRVFPFRGVIFDVDLEFSNSEEWYEAIPEDIRPAKDQPFYHLYAENDKSTYEAYVSEQNLLPDHSDKPLRHPAIANEFRRDEHGFYRLHPSTGH